jgi:hypothetical protein
MTTRDRSTSDKQRFCRGCRDDYYNQPGHSTTGECWSLKNARVVTRYRLGWWTQPTQPGAFEKVTTLSCHYAPGRYVQEEKLPDFVSREERARVERKRS